MFYFLFGCFLFIYLFLSISTLPYNNPYKLTFILGPKGSGKSTTLAKLAYKYWKSGWNVYSTEPLPFAYHIPYKQIGLVEMLPHSVLLVDEVGLLWDNRKFTSFPDHLRDWFKLARHRHIRVYLASQTVDVDKKIRDLIDDIYILSPKFRIFSYGRHVVKRITLTEAVGDQPSSISEQLKFDSILFFWCGSRCLTLIPKYSHLFDSFDAPSLAGRVWDSQQLKTDVQPVTGRIVFLSLVRNFLHILLIDKLVARGFILKRKASEAIKATPPPMNTVPPDVTLEEFFTTPPSSDFPSESGS